MSAPVNTPSSMRPSMRVSRRPAARAGATLAVLALALSGCAGESGEGEDAATGAPVNTESATSGSSSPVASGSAGSGDGDGTPSATASSKSPGSPDGEYVPASSEGPAQNVPVPEMPAAAQEQTQEGLEAALEYWWEAEAHLKATGNKSPMEKASAEECALCNNLMARWSEIYKLGGWAENRPAELTVQFVSVEKGGARGTGSFLVSESKSQIYQPDGSAGGSGDGSKNRPWVFSASFSEERDVWQVDGLEPQG